jgi:hypothetical protein
MITDILTVAEVAVELRCSKAHVYNAIAGKVDGVGPLPAISMGRRRLVRGPRWNTGWLPTSQPVAVLIWPHRQQSTLLDA